MKIELSLVDLKEKMIEPCGEISINLIHARDYEKIFSQAITNEIARLNKVNKKMFSKEIRFKLAD